MSVHVKVWSGTGSATVTDMANAGKRGKTCRKLRFNGCYTCWQFSDAATPEQKEGAKLSSNLTGYLEAMSPEVTRGGAFLDLPFEEIEATLKNFDLQARMAGVPEHAFRVYAEECKGIDAPRVPLTVNNVEGRWSCGVDQTGISLRQYDDVNEWSEITHNQTGPKAYDIAKKVWPKVQAAKTLHEASSILRVAGARLHGYCGMD